MQDKYVGDIGDFGKYSLLNALSRDMNLGIAWYKFPRDGDNSGKHISYLENPKLWRHFDPDIFDELEGIIKSNKRMISAIEESSFFGNHIFASEQINLYAKNYNDRALQRQTWFESVLKTLSSSDIVFADPDNGLLTKETFKIGRQKHGKSIPIVEIRALSQGRPTIIYHHNSRFSGGHEKEIEFWQNRLGSGTQAIRWRHYSARTYFLINFNTTLTKRAIDWVQKGWDPKKVQYIAAKK